MEARNRDLPEWFSRVKTGQVRLPRFQRLEAWSHAEVSGLLESVFAGLPTGAALILEVGEQEPFASRMIAGAPLATERCTEHLLDGQQRLTALWRSLNDDYDDRTYFVTADQATDGEDQSVVRTVARWVRNGGRYPLWADQPREQFERGLIPLRLLRPIDLGSEINDWIGDATAGDLSVALPLQQRILGLRERTKSFNVPFLSLPVSTPPEVAIDVFVKMNTSSVPLSPFDIVVAQVEAKTGRPLRELSEELRAAVPTLQDYIEPAEVVLNVAALREDRSPTQASYFRLDLERLVAEWASLVEGVRRAVAFLEEERIFDRDRLPTQAVIPILSALWSFLPAHLDSGGTTRTTLRKYLWRSFFGRRYENAAGSRALQDYRGLLALLTSEGALEDVPALNPTLTPLPDRAELLRAPWPKSRDTLARAILSASMRLGAVDLADGQPASRQALRAREYHHLFPDSLLTQDGNLSSTESYRALNCALITWNTNRNISAKEPVAYLRERAEKSPLGIEEVRTRVASHLVPFDSLNVGGYAELAEGPPRQAKIRADYESFLDERAAMVEEAMRDLCEGKMWPQ